MRLPSPDTPIYLITDWLGDLPDPATSLFDLHEVIKAEAARRWPRHSTSVGYDRRRVGDDPLPQVGRHFGVYDVSRWLVLVDRVVDPEFEFALSDVPDAVRGRRLGDPWYQRMAYVLVPFANTVQRPESTFSSAPWPPCPLYRWIPTGAAQTMITTNADGTFHVHVREPKGTFDYWVESETELGSWLADLEINKG